MGAGNALGWARRGPAARAAAGSHATLGLWGVAAALAAGLLLAVRIAGAAEPPAEVILAKAGVEAGLAVHLGTRDGQLEIALTNGGRRLVQGLALDDAAAGAARAAIRAKDLYGLASVIRVDGLATLPYVDNLVNLLVADLDALGPKAPAREEILRVLAPKGAAVVKAGGKWETSVKPWPEGLGEWTHYNHAADGNAANPDERVLKPVNGLRWTAGPGDTFEGQDARVFEGRAVFEYIAPATSPPPAGRGKAAGKEYLAARDAFSGVLLWNIELPAGFRQNLFGGDGLLFMLSSRELQQGAPKEVHIEARSLADGTVLRVYDQGLKAPSETKRRWDQPYRNFYHQGRIVQMAGNAILALEAKTGQVAWKHEVPGAEFVQGVAGEGKVFAIDADPEARARTGYDYVARKARQMIGYDLAGGRELWRNRDVAGRFITYLIYGEGAVVAANYVISTGGRDRQVAELQQRQVVVAISAADGKTWFARTAFDKGKGLYFNEQVGVADGRILIVGNSGGYVIDLKTGQDAPGAIDAFVNAHGSDCMRYRATPYYLINEDGLFFDLKGMAVQHRLSKGQCWAGYTPAYGSLYFTPSCHNASPAMHVGGFTATVHRPPETCKPIPDAQRLWYGSSLSSQDGSWPSPERAKGWPLPDEWPTYLGSSQRRFSAAGTIAVPARELWARKIPAPHETAGGIVKEDWLLNLNLAGPVSAPTIADGIVCVAVSDAHRVDAFEASSGKPRWSFTAYGRPNGPPTLYGGMCLFGANDGWVYGLRSSDGALLWRFRAAPDDRQIVAAGQLESTHPVPAPVTLHDGAVYCSAGRQGNADGGVHIYKLDPFTGKMLWHGTAAGIRTNEICQVHPSGLVTNVFGGWTLDGAAGKLDLFEHKRHEHGPPEKFPGDMIVPLYGNSQCEDHPWIHRRYNARGRHQFMCNGIRSNRVMAIGPDQRLYAVDVKPKGKNRSFMAWDLGQTTVRDAKPALDAELDPKHGARFQNTLIVAGDKLVYAADGKLYVHAVKDGTLLAEFPFEGEPVCYGLAAACGNLYLACLDGTLRCFGPAR
jgi:outer membrane protein assembly factor BamB